jgi:hypothetical protein
MPKYHRAQQISYYFIPEVLKLGILIYFSSKTEVLPHPRNLEGLRRDTPSVN